MSDPEGRSPSSAEPRRRRRAPGWRGALIRWLDVDAPAADAASTDAAPVHEGVAPVDIVDQAEAFATLRVADVMTPRADVVALEVATPLDEVVRRFVEVELTRLPIYRETLDDPLGVVHVKDVMRLLAPPEAGGSAAPPWGEPVLDRLKRPALYIPASMRTADLLLRMRAARIHMALVIDEFGGVDGLVTMEDLVEAVVGEIDDEHDEQSAPEITARPGGLYDVDARAPLDQLEDLLGVELVDEDEDEDAAVETVGGLVAALAGRVPQRGEVIVHPAARLEFEVLDADPRRLRRLRVRPAPEHSVAEEGASADPALPVVIDSAT